MTPKRYPIKAQRMSLFPSMTSLDEAMNYIKAHLPEQDSQKVVSLVLMYHNTLVNEMSK